MRGAALLAVIALAAGVVARADDWPQFRGPGGAGVGIADLPERWGSGENLRWTADLPGRGISGPVVAGGRVYLTANSGPQQTRLHVLALDADSGARLWERQFWATGQTFCHPKTCMAAPTPVTDGQRVFALFASGDLIALDAAGDLLWLRSLCGDYPAMTNHVGRGASPVLADGVLVVPMESQGASFVFGIDPQTGRNLWKVERGPENSYTTPLVVRRHGRTDVLVQSSDPGLTAIDPATGRTLWEFRGETMSAIPSPVLAGEAVLALMQRGMVALRPSATGAAPEVAWKSLRLASITPSPVAADGRVYVLKGDILVCGDVADGKVLWDLRLKGPFSASPVLVGDSLYLVNEEGLTSVVRVGGKGELVTTNDLKDTVLATPAVANGALYLRSEKRLYCVGKPNRRS